MKNPAHPETCNCPDCWEPRPLPGETMDDAVTRELAEEIKLMDEPHLALLINMAAAEQHRRHPMASSVPMAPADIDEVKALVKLLIDAFNKRVDDQDNPLDFMDSFMALVNFDRMVLEMIEDQSLDLKSLEQKRAFRSMFIATVSNSLMRRVTN